MPSAPRATPSNITVVPPSGTPGAPGPKRIHPERPYTPLKLGIVISPLKLPTYQTSEKVLPASYFANRYVYKVPSPRSIVVVSPENGPVLLSANTGAGK